jgi:hypothetical protein
VNTRSPHDPYAGQQQYQPRHAPVPPPAPPAKSRRWPWILGIVVAFLVGTGVGGAADRSTPASSPQLAPPAAAAPAEVAAEEAPPVSDGSISDGTHEVGVDVEPGRYKTAGPDKSAIVPMCYWARLKDDSGEFSAIISNETLQGPGSVTLKAGEFVSFSGGCTWVKS